MLLVGLRVREDFFFRQLLSCDGAPGWITDQTRKVADQEDRGVAQILKVLHLPDKHRVAEMDIRRGRIEACFDAQRFAGLLRLLQLCDEFLFANDVDCTLADVLELFFDRDCL